MKSVTTLALVGACMGAVTASAGAASIDSVLQSFITAGGGTAHVGFNDRDSNLVVGADGVLKGAGDILEAGDFIVGTIFIEDIRRVGGGPGPGPVNLATAGVNELAGLYALKVVNAPTGDVGQAITTTYVSALDAALIDAALITGSAQTSSNFTSVFGIDNRVLSFYEDVTPDYVDLGFDFVANDGSLWGSLALEGSNHYTVRDIAGDGIDSTSLDDTVGAPHIGIGAPFALVSSVATFKPGSTGIQFTSQVTGSGGLYGSDTGGTMTTPIAVYSDISFTATVTPSPVAASTSLVAISVLLLRRRSLSSTL